MFYFIIHLLVLTSVNSLSAGETLTEFHINDYHLQQADFTLCPDPAEIAPCVCNFEPDFNGTYMDCTDITSDEELANILQKDLSYNDFNQLAMKNSSVLTALNFTCGSVNFNQFFLYPGPFPSLREVSDDFYLSCSNSDLQYVEFSGTLVSSLVFPPPPLSDTLTSFYMYVSNLTSLPVIRSNSLTDLDLGAGRISEIIPGTFDEIPNLELLTLSGNKIQILKNSSIPITTNNRFEYYISYNGLETIEPGAFTVIEEPTLNSSIIVLNNNLLKTIDAPVFESLIPYVVFFRIDDNPLDCGCDLAWIITNPDYMAKVTIFGDPACADGTLLTDLDPSAYLELC